MRNKIKEGKREKKNIITTYLQNIINDGILDKWEDGVKFKKNIQRLSKAFSKSKKAFKTFDKLRKESELFKEVLDLIPIWIIELDDASRMMPLECNLFDYVILDEASQCNVAYTLPVMFRAKSTIFVGDSEQMRDSTIMFKSNKTFDELASRYCIKDELQIKATGTSVQSVLDIAKNCGFLNKTLRYHYRSPKELIGFSNKYFYEPKGKSLVALNNQYLTYKDTNRIMLIHQVNSTFSEEFADNINVAEAMSILEFYRDLRSDERYKNKQVGILTFFNAQAAYLRELFEKNGFDEDRDNFKIAIIEGIQGDEKDIIIYSFVIRNTDQKKRYYPLTGESGDIRADINKGRVNVAFSRARNQVHCFISMNPADFPEKIWIKKYLQYVLDEGKVKTNSIELKQFDSGFEEEFYNLLTQKLTNDYVIQNQVASCGFKIDFVVQNTKNGKQLAIECDGPTHFKDEIDEAFGIYVESDEERQGVLEIAGWQFIRVKYSDWVNVNFNREKITEYIVKLIG
ncbi:MAG: AAA domain-containing protein [Spirochaetia bacterium]|nr:AAA domain-containing protein [Spirochaetia bacterium]